MVRAFLFVLSLLAQAPAEPVKTTVAFRVIDEGTGVGIANAQIIPVWTYFHGSEREIDSAEMRTDIFGVVSGEWSKDVVLHAGAQAKDYSPESSPDTRVGTDPLVIFIRLKRNGALSGRVVSEESGNPIAGMRVRGHQIDFDKGAIRAGNWSGAITDAEGRFSFVDVPSGDWIVQTNVEELEEPGRSTALAGYPRQFWPGGGDLAGSLPISLAPGSSANFGTLKIPSRKLPSLFLTIRATCAEGPYNVTVEQLESIDGTRSVDAVPCNKPVALANMPPGSYRMKAVPAATNSATVADASAVIADNDVNSVLVPRPLVTIRGLLVTSNSPGDRGAETAFPGSVVLSQDDRNTAYASPDTASGSVGVFDASISPEQGKPVHVAANNLPPALFLDSLRYNGVEIPGAEFVINEFAVTQQLTVILSSGFGSVTGTLRSPQSSQIDVLAVPWPNDIRLKYPEHVLQTRLDENGQFVFDKMRPGHFRLVAVRVTDRGRIDRPGFLMNALPGAVDVEVRSGGNQPVRIEGLLLPQ